MADVEMAGAFRAPLARARPAKAPSDRVLCVLHVTRSTIPLLFGARRSVSGCVVSVADAAVQSRASLSGLRAVPAHAVEAADLARPQTTSHSGVPWTCP
jgi:hypothetical protein